MNPSEKIPLSMLDDISDWTETCIALHQENAEHYAMAQFAKLKNREDAHGATFWLQVATAIGNSGKN